MLLHVSILRKTQMEFFTKMWGGYMLATLAWFSSFFMPVAPFMAATVSLVFLDLFTGRKAAIKQGIKITSRGLYRTIEKIIVYFCAIIGANVIKTVFFDSYFSFDFPITYLVSFVISWTELKSLMENTEIITGIDITSYIKSYAEFLKKPKP